MNPVVKIQGDTLTQNGVELDYFVIVGKGLRGYLKNILRLRKFIRDNNFNIIHAHYSFSGVTAWAAGAKPLIVSILGSDVYSSLTVKLILKVFKIFFRGKIIVKSGALKRFARIKEAEVIPNGVDLHKFKVIKKEIAREQIGFEQGKKYIIFVSNPGRFEKNFKLAQTAYRSIKNNNSDVQFKVLDDGDHDLIPFYMNAADVLLLTSLWEGSPNVVKEAMACNCPIVSTDVGDVRERIDKIHGCYITTFDPEDVAEKLEKALAFGKRTDGREHIRHLDSNVIAKRIIKLYEKVLRENR